MNLLKIILGASVFALSTATTINIAHAGSHTANRYMAPYKVNHGKKIPFCKPKYKMVWSNHVAYCVKKNGMRKHNNVMHKPAVQQLPRGNGILKWIKKNGRMVATCKTGYRLIRNRGKYNCVTAPRLQGRVNQNNQKKNNKYYDKYLIWQGHTAKCTKGRFWTYKNVAHCAR